MHCCRVSLASPNPRQKEEMWTKWRGWHCPIVAFVVFFLLSIGSGLYNESETWDVHHQKGIFKNQNLRFNKINHPTNPFHTCYRVLCFGNQCPSEGASREFCYPAIIVTGLPKCGTSAMYNLLTKLPGALTMPEKENCPYTRRRSHWIFFQSLPSLEDVKEDSIIIDGCVDILNNIKIRDVLREPLTYYVVMIRNYADMLWSSYNFWCHLNYDKEGCSYDRYTNPKYHHRSPEAFHDLIQGDHNGTGMVQPFYYPMHRPCANAGGYYSEFVDFHLSRNRLANYTVVIASEELDVRPHAALLRVAQAIQMDARGLATIPLRSELRLNAQAKKGASQGVPENQYTPGRYAISEYRAMFNETEALLGGCWQDDCVKVAERWGYFYAACLDAYLDRHRLVRFPHAMSMRTWRRDEVASPVKQFAMARLVYLPPL